MYYPTEKQFIEGTLDDQEQLPFKLDEKIQMYGEEAVIDAWRKVLRDMDAEGLAKRDLSRDEDQDPTNAVEAPIETIVAQEVENAPGGDQDWNMKDVEALEESLDEYWRGKIGRESGKRVSHQNYGEPGRNIRQERSQKNEKRETEEQGLPRERGDHDRDVPRVDKLQDKPRRKRILPPE